MPSYRLPRSGRATEPCTVRGAWRSKSLRGRGSVSENSRRSSTRPAATSPSRTTAATFRYPGWSAHREGHDGAGRLNAEGAPPTQSAGGGSPVGRTLRPPINGAPRNEQAEGIVVSVALCHLQQEWVAKTSSAAYRPRRRIEAGAREESGASQIPTGARAAGAIETLSKSRSPTRRTEPAPTL